MLSVSLLAVEAEWHNINAHPTVRTSDPDVANYTLSATSQWINGEEIVTYQLNGNGKVKRSTIDLDNPVQWQDIDEAAMNSSLYQVRCPSRPKLTCLPSLGCDSLCWARPHLQV